jgi:hypothetical protein
MKLTRLFIVFAAVLSLTAVTAGPASATTVEQCQDQLATLRGDTVDAQGSFANGKDFTGLVAKLDAAAEKLAEGKNGDAVRKLTDFQATLNALATAPKPKVDPGVAQALGSDAQGVIGCIYAIGAA